MTFPSANGRFAEERIIKSCRVDAVSFLALNHKKHKSFQFKVIGLLDAIIKSKFSQTLHFINKCDWYRVLYITELGNLLKNSGVTRVTLFSILMCSVEYTSCDYIETFVSKLSVRRKF